jgi:hypothetical protein
LGYVILPSVSQSPEIVLAKRKKDSKKKPAAGASPIRQATEVTVRRRSDGTWELLHPRCALDRADDLREVEAMIAAGEQEIARDELRWLLDGCSDNIAAHLLLGQLAMQTDDLPLARGHFGYAYQIGAKAIRGAGSPAPFHVEQVANQAFFAAGKGLVYCLAKLDKRAMAAEVVEFLVHCNPQDPLDLREIIAGP